MKHKMRKSYLLALLTFGMLIFGVAACSSSGPEPTETPMPTQGATETPAPSTEPTEVPVITGEPENQGETQGEETMKITQFMDCFLPMPIVEKLSSDCWGAETVGARDQGNGLEDRTMAQYSYWDGTILKDEETGKYYMFASRWNQAGGHWGENGISGWQGSQAVYAVSDNLYGPYTDMGPIWPDWCEGAGHNVFAFKLSESDPLYGTYKYAIVISDTGMHGETANGTIHVSASLDGPWELLGKMEVSGGSFSLSNISITVREDGTYEAIERNGNIATAASVAGPWTLVQSNLWTKVDGMPSENVEDPVIWYADGMYHCIANKWDARRAYYLTSTDGISDWVLHSGTAYTPDTEFLYYEDGTANNWTKLERPGIYVEDGEIKAMTFAVIDVQKEEDFGNDQHGSKVIVVPFSSERLARMEEQENPLKLREGIAAAEDTNIQSWDSEYRKNYGAVAYMQVQRDTNWETHGMGILGEGERPDEWYDNKIAFVKFDLSDIDLTDAEKIKKATLSLVYLYQVSGDAEENSLIVALTESSWEAGTGKESVVRNGITWKKQPTVYQENTAVSEMFSTKEGEQEIQIDVTELVKVFAKSGSEDMMISFAFNETLTGNRLRFGSSEAGTAYVPKLNIEFE